MAAVDIFDVKVLDNPAPFTNPLQFEITYDVREALKEDIEWKVIYVGSAEDETRDQELDAVLLPADNTGRFKFVLEVDAPKHSLIPASDLVGVTIVLLTCSYLENEFVRVGYYVSNEYPTPELNENPPPKPMVDQIKRTIASHDPRVTKFQHQFDFCQPASGTPNDPDLSTDGTHLVSSVDAPASMHPSYSRTMDESKAVWTGAQVAIANQVCCSDRNPWHQYFHEDGSYHAPKDLFFGGADVSFSTENDTDAVASLTIVRMDTDGKTELVFSHSCTVRVDTPYVPGFLAFREAPIVTNMLNDLDPQVRRRIDCLLLDGNGMLHPRKAGFACHVGIEHNLPTIGVSKSLLCVDGLDEKQLRAHVADHPLRNVGVDVVGDSAFVWGKALINGNAIKKPIYVSVGHNVSLQTAARVVKRLSTFRIPDPIRYADLHSRAFLRGEPQSIYKQNFFKE